jgi:hypothetical protein
MGRWISPDQPFADQHLANPQSWNLYSYVRNNPLSAFDPTGEAVRLLDAKNREAAEAQVDAFKLSLVNSAVANRLYPNFDSASGQYYLGISGNHSDFADAGLLESNLKEVVDSPEITDFTQSQTLAEKVPNWPFGDRTNTVNIDQPQFGGGAVTVSADGMASGTATIAIHYPGVVNNDDPNRPTFGETLAHEIGHRKGHLHGRKGNASNREAVDAENEARKLGGKARGKRQSHSGGFPGFCAAEYSSCP